MEKKLVLFVCVSLTSLCHTAEKKILTIRNDNSNELNNSSDIYHSALCFENAIDNNQSKNNSTFWVLEKNNRIIDRTNQNDSQITTAKSSTSSFDLSDSDVKIESISDNNPTTTTKSSTSSFDLSDSDIKLEPITNNNPTTTANNNSKNDDDDDFIIVSNNNISCNNGHLINNRDIINNIKNVGNTAIDYAHSAAENISSTITKSILNPYNKNNITNTVYRHFSTNYVLSNPSYDASKPNQLNMERVGYCLNNPKNEITNEINITKEYISQKKIFTYVLLEDTNKEIKDFHVDVKEKSKEFEKRKKDLFDTMNYLIKTTTGITTKTNIPKEEKIKISNFLKMLEFVSENGFQFEQHEKDSINCGIRILTENINQSITNK